jgi:hypothetical protein
MARPRITIARTALHTSVSPETATQLRVLAAARNHSLNDLMVVAAGAILTAANDHERAACDNAAAAAHPATTLVA